MADNRDWAIRVWFRTVTHKPVISLFKDNHLTTPYIVRDTGGRTHIHLSRHKSELASRRAMKKYRRMIKTNQGERK